MNKYRGHFGSLAAAVAVRSATVLTMGTLAALLIFIAVRGLFHISPELFSLKEEHETVSLIPAFANTLSIIAAALLFALPFGIGAAIYLNEYSAKGKTEKLIRLAAEAMNGLPSVIYGLFGYLIFVNYFKLGFSILSGGLTLSLMILPTVMRTSQEALRNVSDGYREGSYALGAGKSRTVFAVVLPGAIRGIMSGVMLAIGRITGETAALLYTAGTVAEFASPLSSGRTLAVHMYSLMSEGLYIDQAYATAVIIIITVFIIGKLTEKLRKVGGA